jgi:segregation and condensation protein A
MTTDIVEDDIAVLDEQEADTPQAEVAAEAQVAEHAAASSEQPEQVAGAHPLATVLGEPMLEMPEDLYIPPEALEVILETFQGPLDLLLYLIRKQNLDILNIPIAKITEQYMEYVNIMKDFNLELAGEYLVMAAILAEIKSRMLLPRQTTDDEEDVEDPRAELIRKLQEYELFKNAAEQLDELPRYERDIFPVDLKPLELEEEQPEPDVSMEQLLAAFKMVLKRTKVTAAHHVQRELLSVREKMSVILGRIDEKDYTEFSTLFVYDEGRLGVVVSFVAILELVKQSMIELMQNENFAPIYVKRLGEEAHGS